MNVLVIGSGGREHALAWKIAQSSQVETVYCAPGNAGIARCAQCVPIATNDFDGIATFVAGHGVGLVVVGPEDPLSNGLVDHLTGLGITTFGPTAAAARLESSKAFAKHIMTRQGIPTAKYAAFDNADNAIAYIREQGPPLVIKADGLAAGKGVTVARDLETALCAVRDIMVGRVFGEAGARVLVEECLEGEEASILAFSDGRTVFPMMTSQDHKPVFDGDLGPNTGGMGAYSPAPVVSADMLETIQRQVLQPCVDGMAAEGALYKGVLYAGLMITADGPKVIEFNCRFGDPEAQVVLPQMKTDLITPLLACCSGTLDQVKFEWMDGACVSVVMASGGYPGPYEKGLVISGLDAADAGGALVFHAGTALRDGEVVTNGGRVLNVTATGNDIPGAIQNAYLAVKQIHFKDAQYRGDIGQKALRRLA